MRCRTDNDFSLHGLVPVADTTGTSTKAISETFSAEAVEVRIERFADDDSAPLSTCEQDPVDIEPDRIFVQLFMSGNSDAAGRCPPRSTEPKQHSKQNQVLSSKAASIAY